MHKALLKCSTYLEKCGGHSMAIGLSLKTENFQKFKEEFEKYDEKCNICDIIPTVQIDEEISLKDINIKAVKELELLEPFGEANRMPIFAYKGLKIQSIRTLTDGKHIKLTLQDNGFLIDAIGFNLGYIAEEYKIGDRIDICGNLEINEFNGNQNIQINIKDIRNAY